MPYGHFSADGREYIITEPRTPRLWHNYSWNNSFLMQMDHCGNGMCQYHDGNSEHRSKLIDHRVIYIQDGAGTFCAGYMPLCIEPAQFRTRVGLGYTVIDQSVRGLYTSWRLFVPEDLPVEIWTLTLRNSGDRQRIRIFPGVHFALNTFSIPVLPHEMLIDAVFDPSTNAIWAQNKSPHRPDNTYAAFFSSSLKVRGFDVAWHAVHNLWDNDKFLRDGCSNNTGGDLGPTVGYMEHELELEAGQEVTWHYLVGLRENDVDAAELT
ncbi:MAG: hypothetical protein GTO63_36855, partial [Anaerolineae bacterium]|nr:hypothetical protein [Anaerolineae bacterium]NIO00325.1 hypothetical protein [Anaerolineae bacterium]NIQ83101.1 hypothetical protein [Anaerolineae bacterium]